MNVARPWLVLSLAALCALTATAQSVPHNANTSPAPATTPADGPPPRQRIGLVLGGGGALGLTEIGVLQWFEENHIPVDVIAGTSMGCMLSAFYATGKSPQQMQQITNAAVFSRVFRLSSDYRTMNFRRRQDERRVPGSFTFGLRHGLSLPRSGVLTDADLNAFLTAEFLPYGDDRDFNSFPIPLRCVATDIDKGELHIFRKGSVATAVRASISVPGVFPALQVDDHTYIDGAILENLPTETEQAELKPDVMIAVSIPLEKTSGKESATLFGVLGRSFSVASWANEQRSRKLAAVVIEPDVKNLTSADYAKAEILTKAGYESAEKNRDALLKYRIDDAAWQQYQEIRHGRVPPAPKFIRTVDVKGPTPALQNSIMAELKPLEGKPLNPETINSTLEDIRSDGRFAANYSVTRPGSEEGGQVHFRVQDKPGGPPFLLLGLNVMAQSGPGASRTTLEGTFLHQDLGGYRSELRGKMAYGYLTNLDFEYYRRLTTSGWFAAPRGFFLRTPVYIFQNQKVIAERSATSGGGAMDFGYSFAQKAEFRAGWEGFRQRWTTKTGSDGNADFSTFAQNIRARYTFDRQDRALIPKHGWRGDFSGGYFVAGTGENAPKVTASASYFFRTWLGNSVSLGGEGGSLFNKRVADPFLFTLGGPLRLSASGLDEYRGTDYWVARPMYLRRLGTLPAPLGQSFYIFTALEAGQMRSPYSKTQLRSDVYFGFTSETPLGVITIGPAFGDGGRRKFVFTLGRFF